MCLTFISYLTLFCFVNVNFAEFLILYRPLMGYFTHNHVIMQKMRINKTHKHQANIWQ